MTSRPHVPDSLRTDAGVPAVARWLLVAVTVLALLGMHSLMGPGAAASHPGGAESADVLHLGAGTTDVAGAGHSAPRIPVAVSPMAEDAVCSAGPCRDNAGRDDHGPLGGGHTLAHLCLAILAGAVAVLGCLALSRDGGTSVLGERLNAAGRGPWRVPPWTQLSLTQLSVLRV